MRHHRRLLGLALILAPIPQAGPSLRVSIAVPPGPHYVGEAIEVRIAVEGEPDTPAVDAPKVRDAEILALMPDLDRPNVARFLVIPGRSGTLDLPPFRVRSGGRSGSSGPTRVAVANMPPEGRTSAFLGGVGPFEVRASATPESVRVGQTLEFRVQISGMASFGSVRPPILRDGWDAALRVEPVGDQLDVEGPASRTFRYRIRPMRSGRIVLPPVPIAAFDPRSRRYATKATAGVTIEVEERAPFDAGRIEAGSQAATDRGRRSGAIALLVGLCVAGSALAVRVVHRRARGERRPEPRAFALELARSLGGVADEATAARAISEALSEFLRRVDGRAAGPLTPLEAAEAFGRITGDGPTGQEAGRLVARCDRARYGPGGEEPARMVEEARAFFEGVAGRLGRGGEARGVGRGRQS